MRRARFNAAGLEAWIFEPEGPASGEMLNVLLCHGFGAPGDDLVPLAAELATFDERLARQVRWIFPQAPTSLADLGSPSGRAWWLIDIEAMVTGRDWDRYVEEEPDGLPDARRALREFIEAVVSRTGVPMARTILGGFSQGAMLSTDIALRAESAPAGLCVLSGSLICRSTWQDALRRRVSMPVFQSHGRQDPLLPFSIAERLHRMFVDAGLPTTWVPFQGQHTISLQALRDMATWLSQRLPPTRTGLPQ